MKKISAKETKEAQELASDLSEAWTNLDHAVDEYNTQMAEAKEAVEEALSKYNDKLTEVRDFRDGIVAQMEEYMDERSDNWRETQRGEAFGEWKSSWEDVELDEIEMDMPDELETPDAPENVFENVAFELEA